MNFEHSADIKQHLRALYVYRKTTTFFVVLNETGCKINSTLFNNT
jgi:hypothetical protein